MNTPHLDPELEKAFDEQFEIVEIGSTGESAVLMITEKRGKPWRSVATDLQEVKDFLATALEEQKEHEKTLMAKSNDWWNKHLTTAIEAAKREEREQIAEMCDRYDSLKDLKQALTTKEHHAS